jgi:hypothetical protein
MADSEFERFKKMFPRGKKDMNIQAVPPPIPGPGGLLRSAVGQAVQSGVRRFSDVNKADKTTKMKDRKGVERRDPMEPRAASSSEKSSKSGVRRYSDVNSANKTTKMKDRKGVERKEKKPEGKSIIPSVRGGGPAQRQGSSAPSFVAAPDRKSEPMSNADVQKAYRSISRGTKTDDPVTGVRRRIATPKTRPADLNTSAKTKKKVEKRKVEKKSKTRIAFEKEFAAARKKGKKNFSSKLGKYSKYSTKLK